MSALDGVSTSAPDGSSGRSLSTGALVRAWAWPAAVCALAAVGLFLLEPFAGGIVGFAGVAYLVTALAVVGGVVALRRVVAGRARPPVAVLSAAWTAAWVLGIVTFALFGELLGVLDDGATLPLEGFTLSPVFWLLSLPAYLVFLVSGLLHGRRRRRGGPR